MSRQKATGFGGAAKIITTAWIPDPSFAKASEGRRKSGMTICAKLSVTHSLSTKPPTDSGQVQVYSYTTDMPRGRMPSNNTSSMFFYTYVIQSQKDNDYYIGYTSDLRKRIEEHWMGEVFATKPRLPFDLVYYEACRNSGDAKQREKYLKTTAGRRFLAKRLRCFKRSCLASL